MTRPVSRAPRAGLAGGDEEGEGAGEEAVERQSVTGRKGSRRPRRGQGRSPRDCGRGNGARLRAGQSSRTSISRPRSRLRPSGSIPPPPVSGRKWRSAPPGRRRWEGVEIGRAHPLGQGEVARRAAMRAMPMMLRSRSAASGRNGVQISDRPAQSSRTRPATPPGETARAIIFSRAFRALPSSTEARTRRMTASGAMATRARRVNRAARGTAKNRIAKPRRRRMAAASADAFAVWETGGPCGRATGN